MHLRADVSLSRQATRALAPFCDAYGLSAQDRLELLDVTAQRIRRMWQVLVDNTGREPHATLVRDGHAEFWHAVEVHGSGETSAWRAMLTS